MSPRLEKTDRILFPSRTLSIGLDVPDLNIGRVWYTASDEMILVYNIKALVVVEQDTGATEALLPFSGVSKDSGDSGNTRVDGTATMEEERREEGGREEEPLKYVFVCLGPTTKPAITIYCGGYIVTGPCPMPMPDATLVERFYHPRFGMIGIAGDKNVDAIEYILPISMNRPTYRSSTHLCSIDPKPSSSGQLFKINRIHELMVPGKEAHRRISANSRHVYSFSGDLLCQTGVGHSETHIIRYTSPIRCVFAFSDPWALLQDGTVAYVGGLATHSRGNCRIAYVDTFTPNAVMVGNEEVMVVMDILHGSWGDIQPVVTIRVFSRDANRNPELCNSNGISTEDTFIRKVAESEAGNDVEFIARDSEEPIKAKSWMLKMSIPKIQPGMRIEVPTSSAAVRVIINLAYFCIHIWEQEDSVIECFHLAVFLESELLTQMLRSLILDTIQDDEDFPMPINGREGSDLDVRRLKHLSDTDPSLREYLFPYLVKIYARVGHSDRDFGGMGTTLEDERERRRECGEGIEEDRVSAEEEWGGEDEEKEGNCLKLTPPEEARFLKEVFKVYCL